MNKPLNHMDVYFEKITLANWYAALISLAGGHRVYYFEVGRFFNRFAILSVLLRPFCKADYHVAERKGLSFEIHRVALEVAENLHQQINRGNRAALDRWQNHCKSDRVHLYIKKSVAHNSWSLLRDYLILRHRVEQGGPSVRLVILDSPINRLLLPFLQNRYPTPDLRVSGLSRVPWRYLHILASMAVSVLEFSVHSASLFWRRPVAHRTTRQRFKVSKEILWGIGLGRRNDDFLVDGLVILPEDILFYYRHGSAKRGPWPGSLITSLANAESTGYKCVNFDRIPLPITLFWSLLLPKYIAFPLAIFVKGLVRQVHDPSASLVSQMILAFSVEAIGWEIFLSSYAPQLNISFDDPYPGDVAATIVLNLHDSENCGIQWGDSSWRAITVAYMAHNIYFSWGPIQEKFWEGNWHVDRIVPTGYIWGQHYQESLGDREAVRRLLLGDGTRLKYVVSLFDEPSSPETHKTEKTVYDFYRLGVELLKRRSDVVIIARPKRFNGVSGGPAVRELIAPYLNSGRLQVWDWKMTDATQVIAVSDVVASMELSAPYLEALCCGRRAFNYTPASNYPSPIYKAGRGSVFFDEFEPLVDAIYQALDHPEENPHAGMGGIMDDVDPYRDFRGMERVRRYIHEMTVNNCAKGTSDTTNPASQSRMSENITFG